MASLSAQPAGTERSSGTWAALLPALAAVIVLLHGFHPFSEDGGLYATGVEYTLKPKLFPHDTAFVTAHLQYSLFAPATAGIMRVTHLSLRLALLLLDWTTAWLTLLAAQALLRRCTPDKWARRTGLCALAAGWTLPIAGTSLYLMDPYVTARSVAMPCCLLAIAFALDASTAGVRARSVWIRWFGSTLCLAVGALFHPLMALYGLLFALFLAAVDQRKKARSVATLACSVLLVCLVACLLSAPVQPAERLAALSRYYWFLSQWQWYERLGLLGPAVVLTFLLFWSPRALSPAARSLLRAALVVAGLCTVSALLFAREGATQFTIARLQPLRGFVLLYAVMLLLLGARGHVLCARTAAGYAGVRRIVLRCVPAACICAMAAAMLIAQRSLYPDSPHVEWSSAAVARRNAWVAAFLWARDHTSPNAFFALDARYVNTGGEDAQTFRAWSQRSALPDFSKDGGEASITPSLAPQWLAGAEAQKGLSELPDAERDARLKPYGITWMLLHRSATTAHLCPYANRTVKICRLQP